MFVFSHEAHQEKNFAGIRKWRDYKCHVVRQNPVDRTIVICMYVTLNCS
jgi:hypothetical protein